MKIIKKFIIVSFLIAVNLLILFFFAQKGNHLYVPCPSRKEYALAGGGGAGGEGGCSKTDKDVTCVVDDRELVNCKTIEREVYVPFSFLKKHYEIHGAMQDDRFIWSHSVANIYVLTSDDAPYHPSSPFMSFSRYQVEMRPRVKYICPTRGVPLSTQWSSIEYAYPTQIAQYGLSHYSRYVENHSTSVGDSELCIMKSLQTASHKDSLNRVVFDDNIGLNVFEFNSGILKYNLESYLLNFVAEAQFSNNSSIAVTLLIKSVFSGMTRHFTLRYLFCDDDRRTVVTKEVDPESQTYIIGGGAYTMLARDLIVDVTKAFSETSKLLKQKLRKVVFVEKVLSIEIKGQGRIVNLTLKSSVDKEATIASADWFIKNQDSKGGWSVPVDKSLVKKRINLKSGWYSAMSQGQAISLLVRAYYLTKRKVYLQIASKALQLFSIDVKENGIITHFQVNLDTNITSGNTDYVWYEEYPTIPSVYVLNGFIYALIGLYDASQVTELKDHARALELYNEGMKTLENLLPLFDTGSGSVYDLRHFTLKGVPPNLARMDYHATHVNQLYLLSHIEPASHIFAVYAKRWHAYINGERAAHN